MAKYKVNGKVVTGGMLVEIAKREFNRDNRGISRYSRPKTHDRAYSFLSMSRKYKVQRWWPEAKMWV